MMHPHRLHRKPLGGALPHIHPTQPHADRNTFHLNSATIPFRSWTFMPEMLVIVKHLLILCTLKHAYQTQHSLMQEWLPLKASYLARLYR